MAIEIYSTDTDSGQISVVRKDGNAYLTVAVIPVGNAPRGSVKFTQDGRGFVSNTSTNTVSEIDALTHREVARFEVGSGPRGLSIVPGERYLLVSNSGGNTVSIVDLETREELAQIAVGRDPRHMAIVGDFAYVSIWGSGYIAKIDISGLYSQDVANVREVGRIRLGADTFPYSLNVDRAQKLAFVACNSVAEVPVIDLATDEVIARVPVRTDGGRAIAFTPDNKYALVTLERDSSIAVIDVQQLEVTRYLPGGPAPRGIAIDDNDGTIYAAAFSRGTSFHAGEEDFGRHGITVVDVAGLDLSNDDQSPNAVSVSVGFGPCSVSVFDTEKVSFVHANVDKSARQLISDSSVGSAG
jgi:YVTN family beta-propeller protein